MSTRLLAVIAEAGTVSRCLDWSERLALAAGDASVEALHVSVDPQHLAAPSEEVDFQYLRERLEGTAAERAQAVHDCFDAWVRDHPDAAISPEWKQVNGAEQKGVSAEAGLFDMLVVARGSNSDSAEALQSAMYYAARPFFVIPAHHFLQDQDITDRIVIAWNGAPACQRAAAGALPWIRASRSTALLLVGDGQDVAPDFVSELEAAAVTLEVVRVGRDDESLGDQIVTEAKKLGASMLVIGAHRHNALIEWMSGHTTDQVFRHADILLLLSH